MKIVYTNYGALVGTEHDGFSTFLGVPYAQPPVGDLRWKAPQPLQSWEGEREATVFAHRAWQTVQQEPKDGQGINYAKEFYADPDYLPPMDEDCLYLNIWTPAASAEEKLPIALWIHGGAFLNGYGSEIEFDGEAFAKRGVILVTINYRLGVFGFLSHPELRAEDPDGHCGNYGILDQIAALRWVYENISAFGGDPERITIFGQSAGAMSVQTLLSSPLTKGMIAGAILQSGGGYRGGFSSNRTMEQAEALGNEYLRICGADSIAEMRRLPPQKLMDKLPELMSASFGMGLGLPCSPVLDGYLLTEEYDTVIEKGHHPDIPYMLGSCRDDMMVTPGTDGHDSPVYLGCVNWSLQNQSLGRSAAYVYQFARRLPGDDAGAFHSAELWYVFHTLSRCWRPMSEADEELSMRMCDYWCNFVKTGDPNGVGLPQWKPCASDLPYVHILDVLTDKMERRTTMNTQELFPPMSERELSGAAISRNAAAQGMVLLKNNNKVLPLTVGTPIALFGNGAARTVRGGTGSGDPFNGGLSGGGDMDVNLSPRYHINILDALEKSYPIVNTSQLLAYAKLYDKARNAQKDHVMSVFAFPEEELAESDICRYAEKTDTAVCVISRNSGEGNDRAKTKEVQIDGTVYEIGDYCLSQTEKQNLKLLRKTFRKLVLILNVAGPISVADLREAEADAILLMGQAGQEGGAALYDVLSGRVTPSGKLTATWGERYEDYPAYETYLKEPFRAPYPEGIYVGYRYFDTFGKQPGYPFGFGLSYTTFTVGEQKGYLDGESIRLSAKVKNTGDFSGKEVLQAYVSAPTTELDMPEKELKGFRKTGLLVPGQEEAVEIVIPIRSLASYSEKHGGYILSAGDYRISLGTSSRDIVPVCCLQVSETICTKRVYPELPLQEKLEEYVGCTDRENDPAWENVPILKLESPLQTEDGGSPCHDGAVTTYTTDPDYQAVMPYEQVQLVSKGDWKLSDVAAGKVSMEAFIAQLSNEQLADLCCGTGWGVSDANNPVVGASSESVPGAAGETTHQLEKDFGVPSVVLADGPGGVRVTQVFEATDLETGKKRTLYHYCTAWPVGTLLAQSFDPEVLESVGRGMAADMEELQIALILGPGINIQRNPMCGRNFEYYSEDPLLTGELAAAQIRGIQSVPGCGGCIKHFAANNQEYNRSTSNSVVGQRALREIYLEPFRIAVEKSQPWSIMTSYNLINGVPSADSYDLCTDLARGEWGFEGLIMTDWNGGSSTPWISMHAGNDLIMPGGKARMLNILQEVETVAPYFDEKGQVLMEQEVPFLPVRTARWNSFVPSAAGDTVLKAVLGGRHLAEERDGKVLVDGEPIYLEAADAGTFFKDPKNFVPYTRLVDTEVASVAEDGKTIIYRGTFNEVRRICRGDIQKCAANILRIIMKARKMELSND